MNKKNFFHKPVLLNEVVNYLRIVSDGVYVDGTLGLGGHFKSILQGLDRGVLLGIDLDRSSIHYVASFLQKPGVDIFFEQGNYKDLDLMLKEHAIKKVDGIIIDLGFSSYQISSADRGFSFSKRGPLDMRYSKNNNITAESVINSCRKDELEMIFREYGEERFARKVAKAIVIARKKERIKTTGQLADIVSSVVYRKKIHPATKVFQALRIYVNDELENLKGALPKLVDCLRPSGRLCVISFHSLEDRIVKRSFRDFKNRGRVKILTKKPIISSAKEIRLNPRARSAKLRCIERK